LPEARIAASQAARGSGSTPLAAIAPKSVALMAVPASRASAPKSSRSTPSAWRCSVAASRAASTRPSPGTIFSATVSARAVELMMRVRVALAMPWPTWRTVSRSSDDTSRSIAPGTGFRLNTGRGKPAPAGPGWISM
jgi:hypothetical protein